MAEWEITQAIDYNPNGDDVDSFSQKVKYTLEQIYICLQQLHSNGAAAGLDASDASPYEIRINTADNGIYIRNGDNTAWLALGEVNNNFGLTPETIEAVRNGGGMKRLLMGTETQLPTVGNSTFDLYFAQETSRVYIWTGSTWRLFLSLNFADMLNYEKYCVPRDEIAYSGADKILRLDKTTGKANVDITGSPEKLCDYLIDVQELGDGHVLVFNAQKQKFVNLPNYEIRWTNTAYQAGAENAGKLIRVSDDGKIHADITGSANKIDGVNIEAQDVNDGEVLQYSVIRNSFVPAKKDHFTDADVTTVGDANKLVKVSSDGKIHADIVGSATKIANVPVNLAGIQEGYVLVYSKGVFVPVKKDEFDDSSATTTGEANKFVKVGEDGKIHANITGSAEGLADIPLELNNLDDGQILVYHVATNSFRNEAKGSVGAGKSLILLDGDKVLGDFNGSSTVKIDLHEILNHSNLSQEVAHIMRLTENLYLALDAADLNPGGYDGLSGETFYGNTNDIDMTTVNVLTMIQGDDSLDVDSIAGLIEGSNYLLTDGVTTANVQIKHIVVEGSINRVILKDGVAQQFLAGRTKLIRSNGNIAAGKISGDGAIFTTNLIPLANAETGANISVSRAHLVVKHENIADAEIKAELALRDATFVKGEVIAIGDGQQQTAMLKHTDDLTAYNFALYFDGVAQKNYSFAPISGQVTFTAPSGTIVSADYFYNWGKENFVEMTKGGTYPDRRMPSRASTQFSYDGAAGNVATLRLTLKQNSGEATNEIISTGTGKAQGFKLAHQAVSGSIWVVPATAPWQYNATHNVVIITAPVGNPVRISYQWKGKSFSADSFAVMFNE